MKFIYLSIPLLFFTIFCQAQLRIGELAPEIKLPDSLGKWKMLSEVKSKLVLLDFWAVWCYPCMKAMPDLVSLYEKYHAKGLEIFAVSLDQDYYSWVDGCRRKHLPFILVNDAYGMNGANCKNYKVSSIPHKLLLKNGVVIGSEMSLYDLEVIIKKELE